MKQQLILPCIPMGATEINNRVGVFRENDSCTYFLGSYPIFSHKADDNRTFIVVTSQLIESGVCRQIEILRAFDVSKSSVILSVKKLRQGGVEAFFKQRTIRYGRTIFTSEILEQAKRLLDEEFLQKEREKSVVSKTKDGYQRSLDKHNAEVKIHPLSGWP